MSRFHDMSAATLLDAMESALVVCGPDGKVQHANAMACQLLGKPKDAIIGKELSVDSSITIEKLPGKDMALLTLKARDEGGELQKLAVADRMIAVGTLAAGVAHELNNPLAYVLSNLRFAAEHLERPSFRDVADLADVGEAIRDAREGAEKMRVIVRDLKSLSRTDEEKKTMVDVRRCLESSVTLAWNEIRHRARLIKDFSEVPLLETNEARLVQVFLNLIINAAQAIEPGSVEQNSIRLETRAENGRVIIRVKDSGSGISKEDMARIFDAFFTTKAIGVGTGLGLAVCHRIVSGLGGTITCESEVGKGTTFTLSLPAPEMTEHAPVTAEAQPKPEQSALVLVVDDDKRVGSALERVLNKTHKVVSFQRASHALEWLAENKPDLILCDVMMPEMTGVDFYKLVQRDKLCPMEKIVFLTGGVFAQSTAQFLDSIDNMRLEKPFEPETIRALVRNLATTR